MSGDSGGISDDQAHANEFLNAVVDVAQIGICIVDDKGILIRVNPAFCRMMQYEQHELVGQHFSIGTPPELDGRVDVFIDAILAESPQIARGMAGCAATAAAPCSMPWRVFAPCG